VGGPCSQALDRWPEPFLLCISMTTGRSADENAERGGHPSP
jgi:hypothetical protein